MAPPRPLDLHVKKEDDSTTKYETEVLKNKAPPSSVDVMDRNKQFET
jgi:hypothetical protein